MEIRQFVAATSQKRGGCSLQQFNLHGRSQNFGEILHFFLDQTLDSVDHSIHFIRMALLTGLKHSRKTCIDYRSRSTALTYYSVVSHLFFSFKKIVLSILIIKRRENSVN